MVLRGTMAKPTFRTLLLNAEQDQVNAELSPEDKEALPLFARTAFSDLIQEVCLSEMTTREGRVTEVVITSDMFPHFHITPAFLVAACARLGDVPHFNGVSVRYFERTVYWEADGTMRGRNRRGVKVTW